MVIPLPKGVRGLRAQAVSVRTRRDYRAGFLLFREFILRHFNVTIDRSTPPSAMDHYLERYTDAVYQFYDGRMRHLADRARLGVFQELSYSYRGHLPNTGRCLTAWRRLVPPHSARPLPRGWVDLFALSWAVSGELDAGVGALLAYEGFLRVSELLGLRVENVLLPAADMELGRTGRCGLHLPTTKRGVNQFVRITDPAVIRLLRWLVVRAGSPPALLFPSLTANRFNLLIHSTSLRWGLPDVFTTHSFRHGRAADLFLDDVAPDLIRRGGRWSLLFSMEPYLQAAASLTFQLRPTSPAARLFIRLGPLLRPFLVEVASSCGASQ